MTDTNKCNQCQGDLNGYRGPKCIFCEAKEWNK